MLRPLALAAFASLAALAAPAAAPASPGVSGGRPGFGPRVGPGPRVRQPGLGRYGHGPHGAASGRSGYGRGGYGFGGGFSGYGSAGFGAGSAASAQALAPAALSDGPGYGYRIVTAPGIEEKPAGRPVVYVLDAPPRSARSRVLSRDGQGGWQAYGGEADPDYGPRIVTLSVPRR